MMDERHTKLAGMDTWMIGRSQSPSCTIVFLHGAGMRAADLTPFAHSLAIPGATFVFPQAPLVAAGGFAWWHVDAEARRTRGAADLKDLTPAGRREARCRLGDLLAEVRYLSGERPLLLAGFSQGGMLACDSVIMDATRVAGLALMSASRIALGEWTGRRRELTSLPAFVSHGRSDPDLAFAAGEALKDFLQEGGASVAWVPFDGGHEIPFQVWREFRRFARELLRPMASTNETDVRYGLN